MTLDCVDVPRVHPLTKRAAVVAVFGALGVAASACGLAVSGLLDAPGGPDASTPVDGSTHDAAGVHDAGLPPTCSTIDAACLGPLPPGWQAVGLSDAGCAIGFTSHPVVTNPRIEDGGCACSACTIVGSYACEGGAPVAGGDGCGDSPLLTATSGTCAMASAQHIQATSPMATGTVACAVANDAGTGATTDPLILCVPGCAADYCGTNSRCVASMGDVACPSGFASRTTVGGGAQTSCDPCPCEAGPPTACGGTVTVYDNTTCTDSGASTTYAVDTCNQWSTTNNYQSVLVELVPPTPSCAAPSTVAGEAGLTGVMTVCCK